MTNYKLSYIEHISQLLIYKMKKAEQLTGEARHELESIQSYAKELSTVYADWLMDKDFDET